MKTRRPPHLIFVCIRNRVRSPFSEFLFARMLAERGAGLMNEVRVSSAGFIPQKFRDRLAGAHVSFPDPFYNRPMAETTRASLLQRGIVVSAEWRSKELGPEMVKDADLMITALPEQKEELINLFPAARSKIFTTREVSKRDGYLVFEDSTGVPLNDSYWDYVEENPHFVSKVLSEMEVALVRAFPDILKQLGVRQWATE